MINKCIKYGPHGPQGPWAHKTKNLFARPGVFPNDMLAFWTYKNLFVRPGVLPNDMLAFWPSKKPLC